MIPVEISTIADRWSGIENRMLEAEQINEATLISAISELRLAGRELSQLLELAARHSGELDFSEAQGRLEIIDTHLFNADAIVTDAIIGHTQQRVRYLMQTYGVGRLSSYVPEITELFRDLNTARQLILESVNNPNKKREIYETLKMVHTPLYVRMHPDLDRVEELSMVYDHKIARENNIWRTVTLVSLGITIVSIAITMWSLAPS